MTRKHEPKSPQNSERDSQPSQEAVHVPARGGLYLVRSTSNVPSLEGATSQETPRKTPVSRTAAFMKAFADAIDTDIAALRRL